MYLLISMLHLPQHEYKCKYVYGRLESFMEASIEFRYWTSKLSIRVFRRAGSTARNVITDIDEYQHRIVFVYNENINLYASPIRRDVSEMLTRQLRKRDRRRDGVIFNQLRIREDLARKHAFAYSSVFVVRRARGYVSEERRRNIYP